MCVVSLRHVTLIDFITVLVESFTGNHKTTRFAHYKLRGLQYTHDYKF
jgi:hypothetical protein